MITKTTKYNEKILKEFLKFNSKKYSWIMLICGGLIIISGVLLIWLVSILFGILSIIVGIFLAVYPQIMLMSSINDNKRMLNAEEVYEFDEEQVHIVSTILGEEMANTYVKYSSFEAIKESADYVYIYTSKTNAIILEKSNMTEKEYKFIIKTVNKALEKKK